MNTEKSGFYFGPTFSQLPNHLLSFSFSLSLLYRSFLVSYFSLAPCARLNWQFSVSFQGHVKSSSSSYRIVSSYI